MGNTIALGLATHFLITSGTSWFLSSPQAGAVFLGTTLKVLDNGLLCFVESRFIRARACVHEIELLYVFLTLVVCYSNSCAADSVPKN